jgi:hypothetical protein
VPKISGVLTIDKGVIYGLFVLFAKATPIDKSKKCLLGLSNVRILLKDTVHVKKAMWGGALTFQKKFQGKGQCSLACKVYNSSSLQNHDYKL